MRLFLSSQHLGNKPEEFAKLLKGKTRVAFITNAADVYPEDSIVEHMTPRLEELKALGLEGTRLDLKKYFGKTEELAKELANYDAVCVAGGNTFVLRRAMFDSGFDEAIMPLLKEDKLVYSGWSAGSCVAAPTLIGIELMDDPSQVQKVYGQEPVWEGMNLVPYSILPHWRSNHEESEMAEAAFEMFTKEKIPFKTLRDGQVIIVDGGEERVVS